jgi:S1-C subfamily serine protease
MIARIAGQDVPLGGDIVLSVDGTPASPANAPKIRDRLAGLAPGTPYKVSILRAGQVLELTGKTQ